MKLAPYHKEWQEAFLKAGHTPRLEEDTIDMLAMASGYHNGPVCTVCGYSPCEHCVSIEEIEPCKN